MPVEALQFMFSPAQQVKKQTDRSARLKRPAMLAVDVVGEKQGLDFIGFIMAIQKVAQTPGQERNELRNFQVGDRPESFGNPKKVRPPLQAVRIDFWRRLQKERLQVMSQLLQLIVHAHKSLSVFERYLAKFAGSTIPVRPPRHDLSIGERDLNCGIARHHAQPVLRQIKIADHFRPQHARNIRGSGHAAAGSNFFRHATTAHDMPTFKDKRRHSGTRQISGGGQSVVTAAHHDRVVTLFGVGSHPASVPPVMCSPRAAYSTAKTPEIKWKSK